MAKSRDAFRTISEVAEWLDTPAHVLRFWESKFTQVKPVKRAGGRRYYRPEDMALLSGIKTLLHDQGLTIKGAQKLLREKGVKHVMAMGEDPDADSGVVEGRSVDVTPAEVPFRDASGAAPERTTAGGTATTEQTPDPESATSEGDAPEVADPNDPWPTDPEPTRIPAWQDEEPDPRSLASKADAKDRAAMDEDLATNADGSDGVETSAGSTVEREAEDEAPAGMDTTLAPEPAAEAPRKPALTIDLSPTRKRTGDHAENTVPQVPEETERDTVPEPASASDETGPDAVSPDDAIAVVSAEVLPFAPPASVRLLSERRTGRIPALPTNPGAFAKPGPLSALAGAHRSTLAAKSEALAPLAARLRTLREGLGAPPR